MTDELTRALEFEKNGNASRSPGEGSKAPTARRRRRAKRRASTPSPRSGLPTLNRLVGRDPEEIAHRLAWGAAACIAMCVIVVPQLMGGRHAWVSMTSAFSGGLALLLTCLIQRQREEAATCRAPMLAFLGIVGLLFSLLQWLPMPCTLVALVAPGAVEARTGVAELLGETAPAWCSISRAPGATGRKLLETGALLGVFLASYMLSVAGFRRLLVNIVLTSVIVMALVALAHGALGADRVFGLHDPPGPNPLHILAPLISGEHLGGYLTLAVAPLVGLCLRTTRRPIRALAAALLSVIVGTLALTLSLTALAATLLAATLVTALIFTRRRETPSRRACLSALAPLALLALGFLAGGPELNLGGANSGSAESPRQVELVDLFYEAPLTGMGRGTFEGHAPGIDPGPHGLIITGAAEWGLPMTALLLGVLIWSLHGALNEARLPTVRMAAGISVIVIGLQAVANQGLSYLGTALAVVVLLAAAVAPPLPRSPRPHASAMRLHRLALPPALGILALAVVAGPSLVNSEGEALRVQLKRSLGTNDGADVRQVLSRAMHAYPEAPFFPMVGAEQALLENAPDTPRWLERALQLGPDLAPPRLLDARWWLSHGRPAKAISQLAISATIDPRQTADWFCSQDSGEAPGLANGTLVLKSIPSQGRGSYLRHLADCLDSASPTLAALDRELPRLLPDEPWAIRRGARRALRDGQGEAALALVDGSLRTHPRDLPLHITRATLLRKVGRSVAAKQQIEQVLKNFTPSWEAWWEAARSCAATSDAAGMRRAIAVLRTVSNGRASKLSEVTRLQGDLELDLGFTDRALAAWEQSLSFKENIPALQGLAALGARTGKLARAERANQRLCLLDPQPAVYCAKAKELNQAGRR